MDQKPKVGEMLLRAGVVDEYQIRAALGEQKRWGRRLGMTLVKMGFMEEADLVRALSSQLRIPVAHLEGKRIHADVLDLIPVDIAQKELVLPLFVKHEGGSDTLYLGMEDPTDLGLLDDLSFRTGMEIKAVLVEPSELAEGIDRFYREHGPTQEGPELSVAGDSVPHEVELAPAGEEISLAGDPAAQLEASFSVEQEGAAEPMNDAEPMNEKEAGASAPELQHAAAVDPSDDAGQRSSRLALQALAQLLIEKGLLSQDELFARMRELQGAEPEKSA